jgi:hypothetical protein
VHLVWENYLYPKDGERKSQSEVYCQHRIWLPRELRYTYELLALQQPCKKAKQGGDTIPIQIREDWSTPENKKRVETAISAVKDKTMSQAQAAVQFGIPASIISKTVNGRRDLDTKS